MKNFTLEEYELLYILVSNLYGKNPSKHLSTLLDKIEENIEEIGRS